MDFDTAQLAALSAVVTHGSFESAATALHVTPSAVSQRIRGLETATRRVLVVRSRPAKITEAGIPVLRLARQMEALAAEAAAELSSDQVVVPLAVNADSLSTWVLPALAPLADRISFQFHRADQEHTADLLRDGTVMAAVTAQSDPVQGCSVTPLGVTRYLPYAAQSVVRRWFTGDGLQAWHQAPAIEFDSADTLQQRFLAKQAPDARPPRHFVPGASDFSEAVRLGYGWGMLPTLQAEALGDSVQPLAEAGIDVPLFWQQWAISTPTLHRAAQAITEAARGLR